ncbi:Hypothetical predicted protein [Mytilus galloprovincialis]|uniref:Uncharacterized protein n=1 Tax=Mytilus galloprovincialis TaxID=29158 RepID=A0A8B6BND4_MYTGA|nr:Hypothetical predicted protein [Mytilus galloprovincialis]
MKSKDPHKALLDYRNTPLDIDLSPAQLFLNRRLKTSLPTLLPLLMPQNVNNSEIIKKLEIRQRKAKTNYDKHCGPELKQLKQGDSIVMYTDGKWKAGKIIQKHHTPRSYVVQTSDGRRYRRNRRHIRPTAYNGNTVDNEHFKNNHNSTVRKTSTVCNTSQTLDRSETVASEENENPCTNGELIEGAALKCTAQQLIGLLQAKSLEEKCGIVLDKVRPCIVEAISTDHNRTCKAREIHELIVNFRDVIVEHLKFDVTECLPVMNCSDFESVMYYLEVSCESQFERFIESSSCGNLCRLGSCMSDAVTAQNKTCSLIEFQNSIMSNRNAWTAEMGTSEVDICCSDDVNSASLPFISVSLNLLSLFVMFVLL